MFALLLLCAIPQSLDQDALPRWRDHIAPAAAESRWQQIGWHATVADGLQQAGAVDRPLLLWLMNGHPLGCT